MRAALHRVTRIALTEATRTRGSFDRRAVVVLLVLGVAMGAIVPQLTSGGVDFDRGLYSAAVDPSSPLYPVLVDTPSFRVFPIRGPAGPAGEHDLIVLGREVHVAHSDRADAALAALEQAVKDHTFRVMRAEPDAAAAFPVRVSVTYLERSTGDAPGGTITDPAPRPDAPDADADSGSEPDASGGASASGGSADAGAAPDDDAPRRGFTLFPEAQSVDTPESMSPPFPFRSLILAYVFLIPMNFVVQVYAGSMIAERLGRKGEALLASPARPWEIITGKTLPYLTGMLVVSALITAWLGGGWLTLLAVVPLVLAFLGLEFVAAMFARSFRELTFLTVFTSVLLTIYAFLPAVFTNVHPIAYVSPITLIVNDLTGAGATVGQVLYATLPLTLASVMLFVLGGALYREEDLFHQKAVPAKAVDMVARQVRGLWSGFRITFLLIPMVFVAELLLVTFLYAWPVPLGLVTTLIAVAVVEEAFKAAPGYAAFTRDRLPRRRAVLFGALTGVGFFAAEKAFLLAGLAGLFDVPAAHAVFVTSAGPAAPDVPWSLVAVLLAFPLVLHAVTAAVSAWGAAEGKRTFAFAFGIAVAVHATYNLAVMTFVGGGLP